MYEPGQRFSVFAALRKAARESGRSRWAMLREFWRLRRAGRRLLLSEYLAFGLWRRGARPEDFVGVIEGAVLSLAINYRKNRRALVQDKLLFDAMMRGLGFPVPELQAVVCRGAQGGGFHSLWSDASIQRFMQHDARYPLFVKPARGQNSQDAMAIEELDRETGELILFGGARERLEDFSARIRSDCNGALLIQRFVDQDPAVTAMTGRAVGTVRVITFLEGDRAHVLRVFWKVPVGGAIADNLWRGNLIASVDEETGVIGTVRTHTGFDAPVLTHHPETGAALTGAALPDWETLTRLCRHAAMVMRGMPLVGWDVALGRDGPMIVEANSVPSPELTQYPDQRGFLIGDLLGRLEAELARLKGDQVREARVTRRRVRKMLADKIFQGFRASGGM